MRDLGLLIALLAAITPGSRLRLIRARSARRVVVFDDTTRSFPAAADPVAVWFAARACGFSRLLRVAVAATGDRPSRSALRVFPVPARSVGFLALTLVLGPWPAGQTACSRALGAAAPGCGGRVRGDAAVHSRGGNPRGGCDQNCSFRIRRDLRRDVVGCARAACPRCRAGRRAGRSLHFHRCDRLPAGSIRGHFASEVIFAALLTLAVIWAIYGLVSGSIGYARKPARCPDRFAGASPI